MVTLCSLLVSKLAYCVVVVSYDSKFDDNIRNGSQCHKTFFFQNKLECSSQVSFFSLFDDQNYTTKFLMAAPNKLECLLYNIFV